MLHVIYCTILRIFMRCIFASILYEQVKRRPHFGFVYGSFEFGLLLIHEVELLEHRYLACFPLDCPNWEFSPSVLTRARGTIRAEGFSVGDGTAESFPWELWMWKSFNKLCFNRSSPDMLSLKKQFLQYSFALLGPEIRKQPCMFKFAVTLAVPFDLLINGIVGFHCKHECKKYAYFVNFNAITYKYWKP